MKVFLLFLLAIVYVVQCRQISVDDQESELPCTKSIRSCICCGKGGDDNPVDKLKKNRAARVSVGSDCIASVFNTTTVINENITQYNQTIACDVGISTAFPGEVAVGLASSPTDSAQMRRCGDDAAFRAFFLPQIPNKVTYMILDSTVAHWFFTATLGGCDMFIATLPGSADKPLLIHANGDAADALGRAGNLQQKGERADEVMTANASDGYVLRARVYSKLETPLPAVETYLGTYKTNHPNVRVQYYDNYRPALHQTAFFGYFSPCGSWDFYIKAIQTGKVKRIRY